MSGRSAASLPVQRSILAIVLCVLAFLFAFEAKLAWYSPASDLASQVSAAKALRVDAPSPVSHGVAAPYRGLAGVTSLAIAVLASFLALLIEAEPKRLSPGRNSFIKLPAYLHFPFDFRPPPAR
jgi:hypothetical protein